MYNPRKLAKGTRLVVNEDPQLANAINEQKKAIAKHVQATDSKASGAGKADAAAAENSKKRGPATDEKSGVRSVVNVWIEMSRMHDGIGVSCVERSERMKIFYLELAVLTVSFQRDPS